MSDGSPFDCTVLNPSVMKERLLQEQIEFARTEQLPASESLTVGEMIELVTVLDRTPNFGAGYPALALQLFRRDEVLRKSEGFREFLAWKDIEFHRGTALEAALEFLARLVDRFRKRSDDLKQMLVLDALRALEESKPPDDLNVKRLTIDASSRTVTFDGKEFEIKNPRAFKIFKMISDADGNIVPSDAIKSTIPGVGKDSRIGQILDDGLPKELRHLVPGQRGQGSGFSLKLPRKRVRKDAQTRAMKR